MEIFEIFYFYTVAVHSKTKKMKKILGITLFVAAFAFGSQAQETTKKDKPEAKGKKEWKHKQQADLNLSETQKEQMKSINSEFRSQAKAIKENTALSDEAKKQQFKALSQKKREKVKAILTEEQQQKIAQQRKSRKKQHNRETSI